MFRRIKLGRICFAFYDPGQLRVSIINPLYTIRKTEYSVNAAKLDATRRFPSNAALNRTEAVFGREDRGHSVIRTFAILYRLVDKTL